MQMYWYFGIKPMYILFVFRTFCANVTVQFMNTQTGQYETAMMCALDTKNQVKELKNKPKVSVYLL